MALDRSARSSTMRIMNDWRPGMSNALMTPCIALSTSTSAMVMRCESVSQASSERLHHGQRLRPHQHLAPVDAVDDDARKRRQQKRGNLAGEADRAQQQRRLGQPVDEPRRGHARHPRADQRDALPAEEEPEVAMAQRAPGVRQAGAVLARRRPPMRMLGALASMSCFLDARRCGDRRRYFATVSLTAVFWSTRAPAGGCCAITEPGVDRRFGRGVRGADVGDMHVDEGGRRSLQADARQRGLRGDDRHSA